MTRIVRSQLLASHRGSFGRTRARAIAKGYAWKLTLAEFCALWPIQLWIGRARHKRSLCLIDDAQGYIAGNVYVRRPVMTGGRVFIVRCETDA